VTHFAQVFWMLSAAGAALFFMAGLSSATWRRAGALSIAARAWGSERAALELERNLLSADARAATRLSSTLRTELAREERDAREAVALRHEKEAWTEERAALMAELAALIAERNALAGQVQGASARCARLDAQMQAVATRAGAERTRLLARIEAVDVARKEEAPLPFVVTTDASGETFTAILGRIGESKGMRSAVLGDALGLPIASLGEHPEPLAGFCGFIAQAASKAADFLPLGHIRRIVIEDDRLATLTACSLEGSEIFVATLTHGPGPELPRMMQILNDASSFVGERNRA
jgi:hypothetical protein